MLSYPCQHTEHPHHDGARPTERQEADGLIQGSPNTSFGLASSCPRSHSDTVRWHRRSERTSISNRGMSTSTPDNRAGVRALTTKRSSWTKPSTRKARD